MLHAVGAFDGWLSPFIRVKMGSICQPKPGPSKAKYA